MRQTNWLIVSTLIVIVLASGIKLYIDSESFEIRLQDDSVKVKYNNGVFKLYDGRYKVLENYYSPECYDRGYKKVYKSRGEKYDNLSYYNDNSNHYISQVIHYSKGDLVRKFVINDNKIKEALEWIPDDEDSRCRIRLKYSSLDLFEGDLIYSKNQEKFDYNTDLENDYKLDWAVDSEKISYVRRYDNGRLDIMTLPFTGTFDYDPTIYLGEEFTQSLEQQNSSWVNTESTLNYRDFTVSRTNSTLYCNNASSMLNIDTYDWYKNDIAQGVNSSSFLSNNFMKGDEIYCQRNGINSTNRFIIDTTIGDFSNGTTNFGNLTFESGNVTLSHDENNLVDTLLLMHFDSNYTQDFNLTDDVSIYDNNGYCYYLSVCPEFNSSGYIGGAFEFDGVNDYINTSSDFIGINTVTVSAWIYVVGWGEGNRGRIIDNGKFYWSVDNSGTFEMSSNGGNTRTWAGGPISLNNWYHMVLVRHSSGLADIYKDGVMIRLGKNTGTPVVGTKEVFIGSLKGANTFDGKIDEVRVWNRSLTADEIRREYQKNIKKIQPTLNNYEHNATFTSEIFDLGKNPNMSEISWGQDIPHSSYYFQDGLVFGWDGAVNYSYVNTSIHLNSSGGVMIGGNTSIFPDNNATTFDGVDDYINTSLDINLSGNDFTTSVWVKINGANRDYAFTQAHAFGSYASDWIIHIDNSIFWMRSVTLGLLGPYEDGEWHHYVMVWDRGSETYEGFVDGVSIGTSGTVSGYGGLGNVKIGSRGDGATAFFNGNIDETHIWDRSLSAGEINHMYNISKNKYPIVLQTRMGTCFVGCNTSLIVNEGNLSFGDWTNSTGGDGYYLNATGELINSTYNGTDARYIQYRALFETLDTNVTPKLTDVLLHQTDFKTKIFASEPIGNYTQLYPETLSRIPYNFTYFNLSDLFWLDWGYNDVIGDKDLVAYWSFEDNWNPRNGTSEAVSTPTALPENAPTNVTGKVRQGISFNSSKQYLDYGDDEDLDIKTSDYSISLWFKHPEASSSHYFIEKYASSFGYSFRITSSGKIDGSFGVGGSTSLTDSTTLVDDNQWHHVVFTMDRDGLFKYYIDNVVDASTTDISGRTGDASTTGELQVGSRNGISLFNGTIDEILFYSRLLTTDEISNLYDKGKLLFELEFKNDTATLINSNSTNWEFNYTDSLAIANYSWRTRLYAETTIADDIFENQYSDWSSYSFFNFTGEPIINFIEPTTTNATHFDTTAIWANISYDENALIPVNLTFRLYNSTGLHNITIQDSSFGNWRFINWTGLNDDDYIFNVTATTIYNTQGSTPTIFATIDRIQPSFNVRAPSSDNSSIYLNGTGQYTLRMNITVEDDNLYFVNLTIFNVSSGNPTYTNSTDVINQSQFNITDVIDTSGYANGYYRVYVRAEDDLSDSPELPNFKAKNVFLNPSKTVLEDGDKSFTVDLNNGKNIDKEVTNDGKHIKIKYTVDNPGKTRIRYVIDDYDFIEDRSDKFPLFVINHEKYLHWREEVENGFNWHITHNKNSVYIDVWKDSYKGERIELDPQSGGLNIREENYLFFLDNEAPLLTLTSPVNNTYISETNGNFTFYFSDVYGGNNTDTTNCSLYIDGALNTSGLFNVSNVTDQRQFEVDGLPITNTFLWRIDCFDTGFHLNQSETRLINSEIKNMTWMIWNNTGWFNFTDFWLNPTCEIEEQNCTEAEIQNQDTGAYSIVRENETFTPIFRFENTGNTNIINVTLRLNATNNNIVVRARDTWNTSNAVNISTEYTQVNYNNTIIKPGQFVYVWLYFDYYRPLNISFDWPNFFARFG